MLKLNLPVLLLVDRENGYQGWSSILNSNSTIEDAKNITDFATSKGLIGVIIYGVKHLIS